MRCEPAHYFSVAKAVAWRSAIDTDPAYQRAGEVWSLAQRQLFLDSLLNGYDVPKIYFHDLRGRHPTKVYAIVDGKQRLTTLWSFIQGAFPLAETFRVEPANQPDLPAGAAAPVGAIRFSQFDAHWRSVLLSTFLSVVLIRDATEADIEELFSRLNNGVPLSAAERRNAFGGAMAGLIREVAAGSRVSGALAFANGRGEHLDVAVRLLAWEDARRRKGAVELDLSPAGLDDFVIRGRRLAPDERADLAAAVDRRSATMADVFRVADPLLSGPDVAFDLLRHTADALGDDPSPAKIAEVRDSLDEQRSARQEPGLVVRD